MFCASRSVYSFGLTGRPAGLSAGKDKVFCGIKSVKKKKMSRDLEKLTVDCVT